MFNYFNILNDAIDKMVTNNKLSKKQEAALTKASYILVFEELLTNIVSTMIEYDDIYDGLDMRFHELYRMRMGTVGSSQKSDGKIVSFMGSFSDQVNDYGIGSKYIGTTLGGYQFEIKDGVDGAVCWNNNLGFNDSMIIHQYAQKLAEISVSIDLNVFFARYAPLFRVQDNKVKQTITEALSNIEIGKIGTFVTDITNLEEIMQRTPVEKFDLTDVKNSDKVQYLYKAMDDTLRQFFNFYGISLNTTGKMAQQTSEELNQTAGLSMIYPINRLKMADEYCEKMNKIYHGNMSAHFSEVWQIEYSKYVKSMEAVCDNPKENELESEELPEELPEDEDVEKEGEDDDGSSE